MNTLRKRTSLLNLMLLPATLITYIFVFRPIQHWKIAFFEYQLGTELKDNVFIGLKYFKEFFCSYGDAWPVIRNTILINLTTLFLSIAIALLVAFFLQTIKSYTLRFAILTITLIPYFFSWPSVATVANCLFSYNEGLLNNFLSDLFSNYQRVNFLGDPNCAQPLMVMISVWKEIGFSILMISTAMEQLPIDMYDAAEIDGASAKRKFLSLTLPGISSTIAILIVLELGWILSSDLDKYYLFTNPTNITKMEVLDMYIYRYGLKLGRFSYAAAVSIIKSLVSIILVIFAFSVSNFIKRKK